MSSDRLYRELCKPEILRIGWHLAHLDSRDDFLLDPIGYSDFAMNLDGQIEQLREEIAAKRFRANHILDVEIPKSGLSVRPGNVLPIRESVLLHAIIYLIGPRLDNALKTQVHSYRIRGDWRKRARKGRTIFKTSAEEFPFLRRSTIRTFDEFESWYEAWPKFDAEAKKAHAKSGYGFLTKTDITAYFENVDLAILEAQLRARLPSDNAIIQLLMRILQTWTRTTSMGSPVDRGIPQGNDVSSILANLFLLPLDTRLDHFAQRRGAVWMRYVDDVKIFSRSMKDARDVVFIINEALRELHLNLQGAKTEILEGARLSYEMDTSDLDKIKLALDVVAKLDPNKAKHRKAITAELARIRPIAGKFRKGLPNSIRKLDWKENRTFRRVLSVYQAAERPYMQRPALAALRELPDTRILNKCLGYLLRLPYSTHDTLAEELLTIIEGDLLPFPFQVAKVIEAFRFLHPETPNRLAARIRQYALGSPRRAWIVRAKALESIGSLPYLEHHAFSVAKNYLADGHFVVRRAASTLIVRGPKDLVRESIDQSIYHPDSEVSKLGLFWMRFMNDETFAKSEIERLLHNSSDNKFVRGIAMLYSTRCSDIPAITKLVQDCAETIAKSKSIKLRWHADRLIAGVT